jgi:hypothetical protein
MIALIVFGAVCGSLAGALLACGMERIVQRDQPGQGLVNIGLAAAALAAAYSAIAMVPA